MGSTDHQGRSGYECGLDEETPTVTVEASDSSQTGTGPGITKVPPPPKHKNNAYVKPRDSSGFLAADQRRAGALSAGRDADSEIADAMLGIIRGLRLLCVTETQSELGRDEHMRAVLRRLACGEPGAVLLDGHYVLTEDAHGEELELARRQAKQAPTVGGEHWIFTFGYGHVHPETGASLSDRYVRLPGNYQEARAEMVRRFGVKWAFQYADDPDGLGFGTELVLKEDA